MRLGVSYNVFDGEELLEESITKIRDSVDFICIVYQNTSNFGEFREDLEPFLYDLKSRGLIDYLYLYNPKEIQGRHKGELNEVIKRNIGRDICVKVANCSHHITMDCDEIFVPDEFKWAKNQVIENDYDTTYVSYDNYYKKRNLIISQKNFMKETKQRTMNLGYMSFIVKCDERNYGVGLTPLILDPTRTIDCKDFHIFNRRDIKMHHYSYIRKNEESLRRKLNNTSQEVFEGYDTAIAGIVKDFNNYKPGDKATVMWVNGFLQIELIKTSNNVD